MTLGNKQRALCRQIMRAMRPMPFTNVRINSLGWHFVRKESDIFVHFTYNGEHYEYMHVWATGDPLPRMAELRDDIWRNKKKRPTYLEDLIKTRHYNPNPQSLQKR